MIETSGLTKRFDDILAVDHISAKIRDGSVFGLIGTNGAGKSTFLRMVSGILKPDEGEVLIDGENVYENPAVKARFFYISDDQYFFANGTPLELMKFYKSIYPAFDEQDFSISYSPLIWTKRERSPHFKGNEKTAFHSLRNLRGDGLYLLRRDLRRSGSGDASGGKEPVRERYGGAESDSDHRIPQPERAGGYL